MPPRRRSHPGTGSPSSRYPGSFLLAFRAAAAGMKWEIRQIKGDVAECADGQGREHIVGLENLFRRARQIDREGWPKLIAEFLTTVAVIETDQALPEKLDDFTDQLLLRLGPPMAGLTKDARVWSQKLAGTDLWVNLVIDYPNRMAYVTEHLVQDSGRPGGHWLEVALNNLQARTPAESFGVIDPESGLRMCASADSYDSSRALLLTRLLPDLEPDGCFVAMPGRDSLFVLPVTAQGILQVHLLKVLAEKNYKTEPYPISDEVFWIQQDIWRLVSILVQGNQVTVTPPPELIEILERLAPKEESPGSNDLPQQ